MDRDDIIAVVHKVAIIVGIFAYLTMIQVTWLADPYGLRAEYIRCKPYMGDTVYTYEQTREAKCLAPAEVMGGLYAIAWPITWFIKGTNVAAHNVLDIAM